MGVDTYAFIKSNAQDMHEFVKKNFDANATLRTTVLRPNDPDERNMYELDFMFGDEQRGMYIHDMQFGGVYVKKEEDWYFKKYGVRGESSSFLYHKDGIPDNTPGVICSVRCWGSSVLIMDLLCVEFGGWIDENDCDSESYRKGASKHTRKKLVRHVFTTYKVNQ